MFRFLPPLLVLRSSSAAASGTALRPPANRQLPPRMDQDRTEEDALPAAAAASMVCLPLAMAARYPLRET
ncbi:hypothetical protein BS78_09G095300 [Paspalum vaginatum]|uniref:Secreted protein n=1 Tax=Paspalum vaginatum TaxID=158149 RepID=A0A9W7X7H9_9POAL|nr:hypothetical protein BS78_K253900 [Paspalum vaginatum]KAJ1262292.1 hypothetical protein BS78_09G095300 [Paspalum vaginatum]